MKKNNESKNKESKKNESNTKKTVPPEGVVGQA
jgi:hypothetical protein